MKLPILQTSDILTGREVLKERQVEWVSVIEGAVEDFVRNNELILTMGMDCENQPDKLLAFIEEVYESGAAALGIAVGRYLFDIPQCVIDFATRKQFIILTIPWEIRFSDIQRAVMSELNAWQEDVANRSRKIQKRLIDLVIQGKTLSDIVRYAERSLGWTIAFVDKNETIIPDTEHAWRLADLWSERQSLEDDTIQAHTSHHIEQTCHEDKHVLKKPISAGGVDQGSFIVMLPKGVRATGNVLHILEYLSASAALWKSREDAIVQTENRLRNDFIWNLAKTPGYLTDHIHNRAKILGYNLYLPYVCIVGISENIDALSEARYDDPQYGLESLIFYMEEEIRYACGIVNKRATFTLDDDLLIIFLEAEDDGVQGSVHYFLDLVEKRMNALIPGVVFSWGIGQHEDGIMVFHNSYQKAHAALDMGRRQKGKGERVHYEDTQLNRLMLTLAQHEDIQDITLKTLAPLIRHDQTRGTDLVETVNVYMTQNSNVSRAARILNLHRQSLLYRLRKIESLTGLSLVNPDDVFLLQMSVKVWHTGVLSGHLPER